ncbi:hypothetical protein M501DRAFT_1055427 [Patellaria atrata CBS 101060]|uniref:Uncharacterized protein n=1 Tax=Patellaria atrata CBS 101060 TaxID=1346257 RepID=A0A9P4VRT3_9PEZI|nr:hypothetical protein M501DRAFT_1055427 [Patellaria atrata CBS 101060]
MALILPFVLSIMEKFNIHPLHVAQVVLLAVAATGYAVGFDDGLVLAKKKKSDPTASTVVPVSAISIEPTPNISTIVPVPNIYIIPISSISVESTPNVSMKRHHVDRRTQFVIKYLKEVIRKIATSGQLDTVIQNFTVQVATLEKEVGDRQWLLDLDTTLVEVLRKNVKSREQELANSNLRNSQLEKKISSWEGDVTLLQKQAALEAQLADKDAELIQKEATVQALWGDVRQLEREAKTSADGKVWEMFVPLKAELEKKSKDEAEVHNTELRKRGLMLNSLRNTIDRDQKGYEEAAAHHAGFVIGCKGQLVVLDKLQTSPQLKKFMKGNSFLRSPAGVTIKKSATATEMIAEQSGAAVEAATVLPNQPVQQAVQAGETGIVPSLDHPSGVMQSEQTFRVEDPVSSGPVAQVGESASAHGEAAATPAVSKSGASWSHYDGPSFSQLCAYARGIDALQVSVPSWPPAVASRLPPPFLSTVKTVSDAATLPPAPPTVAPVVPVPQTPPTFTFSVVDPTTTVHNFFTPPPTTTTPPHPPPLPLLLVPSQPAPLLWSCRKATSWRTRKGEGPAHRAPRHAEQAPGQRRPQTRSP